ncbi:class I SAM-dependent methyltransferase [Deefgea piscis]|uniref:Class I SAM-dependent methyltransferase n=1 Tax=Deefgea piscis TaxID=2739061 RepID=A0A6M8SRC9_9NEIS|nr:class I SAM-dependent methyltransferase [Deefgea piscis]QKJ67893.1 class I SAM-dependent methyltransferase [Deefgea piscis]
MAEDNLIEWKTDAWKDNEMVAWYSLRMRENFGTNRLKNKIETDICENYVSGKKILDVGIGTGRASIPLLSKGYDLTGVDSSQAMLDECRRQAGNYNIELKVGDVTALPFDTESFDSLISLNVMTHFPHVEEVLKEWKRVTKKNGKIIFDLYSLDHLSYARNTEVCLNDLLKLGHQSFNMHIKVDELVEICNKLGLTINTIIPYGSLFSGEYVRSTFKKTLQQTNWWSRQLSWISIDDDVFDFCYFLDRHLFGCLPVAYTGRFMVVLENKKSQDSNVFVFKSMSNTIVSRNAEEKKLQLKDIESRLMMPLNEWRDKFNTYLYNIKNKTIAYFLLTSCFGRIDAVDWMDFSPTFGAEIEGWLQGELMDQRAIGFARGWHFPFLNDAPFYNNGVNLASGLNYEMQKEIITSYKLNIEVGK